MVLGPVPGVHPDDHLVDHHHSVLRFDAVGALPGPARHPVAVRAPAQEGGQDASDGAQGARLPDGGRGLGTPVHTRGSGQGLRRLRLPWSGAPGDQGRHAEEASQDREIAQRR